MKYIKIFAFLAVFLLSAFVSSAWAKDVTLTYKISVTGTIPHAYITNADGKTVCDWRNGIKTLWPANEEHSMNDGYGITFTPDQDLDKTDKNENKKSTSTTAFRTEENTIFTVSVGNGFYFKSVTFKEDNTEKASSSNIAPNSTSISVSVPKNKFFNYITVVLTNDFLYIDENGKEQIRKPGEYTVLTSLTDVSNLGGGWYVVQGEVKYSNQVKFSGDAHLILADEAKLEIKTESKYGIYASNNLTIYGQNGQSGILNDTANGTGGYGIYSNSGDITIIGGTVEATGKDYGIYGYKGVTINGGTVSATGKYGSGIYSYSGDITINGGSVTASGSRGYGIVGNVGVTISGGTVTATGAGYFGIHSSGNIILGWTNSTDFIKASGYYSVNGTVSIAEGKSFKDEKGYVYRGTLNAGQLSSLKGQKLEPFEGVSVSFVDDFSGASDVFAEISVDGEGHVSTPSKPPVHSGYAFVGWFTATDGNTEFDFTATVTENTTAYAHWNKNTFEYIDENGTPKSVIDFIVLTEDNKPNKDGVIELPGGWYVVQGKVKYTNQVKFSDDAHLILADGAEMEIVTESKYGIYASNNLTIYGQNGQSGILNDTAKGTKGYGIYSYTGNITIIGGKVTATGSNDGISGPKGVSIIGGSVTATGTNAYGIISSNGVTISGGSVTATGLKHGIYSIKNVTIRGGTVEATGKSDTGIYGFNGVTISGGSVTASGDYGISSRGGNITLGWTNSTDSIKASSYYGKNGVSIAEGKSFKDENGIVYSGTLTGEQLSAIKSKKLEPCYAVTFDAQNGDDPIMLLATFDENGVAHVKKPNDPIRSGFTFEGWFAAPEGGSEFDFSAAITGNTTAYAKWKDNALVEYIDENGKEQIRKPGEYTVLTSDVDDYIENGVINLNGGWYVVKGEVKYSNQVKFSGDAHLILADDAKLEIGTESKYGIYASNNLTIYGQNGQSGILNDTANGTGGYGIYSYSGDITINGGSVTAAGKYYGIYSRNGNITISGGTVEASGSSYCIYGYEGVTISGGTVEATGKDFGIYGSKGVTISGGNVTATGGIYGIYGNSGDITLGWTNSTDSIKASSYYSYKGSVQIAEDKSFKDEKGYVYRGMLTAGQLASLKGQKLEPFEGVSISFVDNISGASDVFAEIAVDGEGHVSVPSKHPFLSGYAFVGWFAAPEGDSEFDFTKAVTKNTTAYAKWKENAPVEYIDENGGTNETKNYILLTNGINVDNLPGGWYVVEGEVKYTSQVKFSGDAHLILADGAKLEIETEGKSEHGIYASNNLTIYGQNEQSDQSDQSGTLKVTATGSGIYSRGNITIIGGSVTASGSSYGIYSYNGYITISGGTVEATSTDGDGICSYFGDITISGGKVTATGTNGDGIYSKKGNITINGGTVTASGNSSGINTAGHITLGWTNSTDFIKVSSILLGADSCTVSIAKGKSFVDENGNEYRDTLTDENLESIKNKTLTPLMPFPDNIVIANISGATYTGDSIRPEPGVTIGENELELGKDYTLAYKDNLNASDAAKVIVKGAGKYYGEVQKLFTIDKAPLKITALNDTIVYGDEPANQGVAYDGFVGNETSEVLKGELALEIGYKRYDDAGKYAITPRGLNADNYKIEFVAGTLTVEPKVISIVWGERTEFDYDGEAHAPTVTAKDFVEGHEVRLVVTGAAVEVGNYIAKVALDENDANSKNYKLRASELEKKFKIVMPVAYIDENGVKQTVTDYTVLTENTSVGNLPEGWYVVQGEVKYTSTVLFRGDAHLILADGAKMEIKTEDNGINATGNLTIYGQNEQSGILNDTANGTNGIYSMGDVTISGGKVTATGEDFVISGKGTVTISGGKVTATSKSSGGISGHNGVTISGGTVEATGTNGPGIHSDNEVTISGGTVEATSTNGPGIHGDNEVTISGGTVAASGGYGIYSYNGNITLGWTNSTDFIYASSYYSENGISIAEGKSFKDEKGKAYSGTINRVSDIAGKTLVPSFNGKFLSDVNIAVADIPVQKYADGKPVCPSVLVTDGKDTLKAGTDYTVTCVNNTTVSSARLDKAAVAQITGKGNYAGVIQKRFFIWNNIRDYAAVQVFQDADGKTHAEIDGAYDGTDAVAIDEEVAVDTVVFNREFTVNLENGGFSTIMLPFDVSASNLTGVKSIFEFNGVDNGKNTVGVNYVWCNAKQGKIEKDNNHPDCNDLSVELKAYTPYMVEMETPTLGINGKVTLKSSDNATNSVVRKGKWVFRGALKKKEWSKEDDDIKNGQIWAFAGSARNGASIGKFVQFGGNNWVNPFRAYLVDCTKYPDASECKDETQPEPSFVSRYRFADALAPTNSAENSLSAKTPAAVAASETALLNSMDIVIVYGDKDSVGEHTTVIGRMNPATGEIRMLPRTKQTYDLKGRRVNEGRKAKGAYYRR